MRLNLHVWKHAPLIITTPPHMSYDRGPSVTLTIINGMPDIDRKENRAYPEYGRKPWETIEKWNVARESYWRFYEDAVARETLAWTPLVSVTVQGVSETQVLDAMRQSKDLQEREWGSGAGEVYVRRFLNLPPYASRFPWVRTYIRQASDLNVTCHDVRFDDGLSLIVGSGDCPVFVADRA